MLPKELLSKITGLNLVGESEKIKLKGHYTK